MTEGVPGQDPEPTVLGSERDTIKDLLVALVSALARPVLYVFVPPLLLYRGRPITERLWKWRWVYPGFVAGAVVLSLPSGNFAGLMLAPVFHLFVIAVSVQVLMMVVPGVLVPASATPPMIAQVVAVISVAVAFVLSLRSTWGASDIDTDPVSLDAASDEYIVPLTEVWDSGGKHD
jgi:hypothetical protein